MNELVNEPTGTGPRSSGRGEAVTREWVAEQFGLELTGDARVAELVRLGLRRNPRRAHLLVSTVLGKHWPADPRVVHASGLELGRAVRAAVGAQSVLVLGFAETATGLGHCVAEALGADYLHSTRRAVATAAPAAGFTEEHSHATDHRLLPEEPGWLSRDAVLVLVDDELSTGRTAMNTIAALHARRPRDRYVLATLVDLRPAAASAELERFAADRGIAIDVVALARGALRWPADLPARAAALTGAEPVFEGPRGELRTHRGLWPDGVRESGRHGFTAADVDAARLAAKTVAAELARHCEAGALVLGTEELMYAPLLVARELAELLPGVRMSSTTRSPVVVHDVDGYPVRDAVRFASCDTAADGPGPRFAYNVGRPADLVLVVDDDADRPALWSGLVERLRERARRVHVVVLPTYRPLPVPLRGPDFGSYGASEVTWLLTDLSGAALEAPTEEREEAIQSGGAHYAESLPVEYQPDAEYQALYARAVDETAARIAHAVGVVTELVLAERGPAPVLASLARAGTPVGALMRRWARFAHGADLPHYAVSIVRGRGIDEVALRWLAAEHDSAAVVFVDGWTGKGAIARELAAAVASVNSALGTSFSPELAVLADPGSCVRTFGTRDDSLISTASGLVSRTVLNRDVLAPGQFHGAKFYRELAGADVSTAFLDAVSDRFPEVAEAVAQEWPVAAAADRTPTWSGWRDVERISERYGIGELTLVKPGVGETTRVLLRRVPWRVLVRPDAGPDLAHVRLLAQRRGVELEEVPDLTYACVGLIHPRYTRGATGADGRAVLS